MKPIPYSFLIVDNMLANNFNAITQPFKDNVWICFLFSVLIMPLPFIVTSNTGLERLVATLQNYYTWIMIIFACIIRQCKENVEKLLTTWQCSGIWLLWNFLGLILSSCYDGKFYSSLASEKYFVTPNNLLELSVSKIPVVTISYSRYMEISSQIVTSTLVEQLTRNYSNRQISNTGVVKLPKYYDTLASNVHFIDSSTKSFKLTYKELDDLSKGPKLGKTQFALVDKDEYVKFWGFILEFNLGNKVVKRDTIHEFSLWEGWFMRRYIAYNHLNWIIWQTVEGGFQNMWETNQLLYSQLSTAKQFRRKKSLGNIFPYFYNIAQGVQGDLMYSQGPQAMSIATFWVIIELYLILITCSLGMMIIEQLSKFRAIISRISRILLVIQFFGLLMRSILNGFILACTVCLHCVKGITKTCVGIFGKCVNY
jgi:hypothetical protein